MDGFIHWLHDEIEYRSRSVRILLHPDPKALDSDLLQMKPEAAIAVISACEIPHATQHGQFLLLCQSVFQYYGQQLSLEHLNRRDALDLLDNILVLHGTKMVVVNGANMVSLRALNTFALCVVERSQVGLALIVPDVKPLMRQLERNYLPDLIWYSAISLEDLV